MALWLIEALDFQSRGRMFITTGCSKVNSAFHPAEVDQMNTKNFWEFSSKK